ERGNMEILPKNTVYRGTSKRQDSSCEDTAGRKSNVGGDAGYFFPDDKLVDVVSALVGEYGFEIVHMAHDAEVVDDAVCAEDVSGFASDFEGDADVVHFEHGDVGGVDFAGVLEAANLEREELRFDDFCDHPGEFFLNELVRGDGLVGELLACFCVLKSGIVASHSRANCAP